MLPASERGLRHLVSIDDVTPAAVEALFARARALRTSLDSGAIRQSLAGKIAINLFLEASTRTRVSFEMGQRRLGMHAINLGPQESSLSKGESFTDTRLTLESYLPDLLVVRSAEAGLPQAWAQVASCTVINGGDGANEHPTQALYDRYTIQEAFGGYHDKRILFVGDIAHSRVVGSHVRLAALLGTKVYLAGPSGWTDVAEKFAAWPAAWEVVDVDAFLPQADVINPLRVQLERGAGGVVALEEYIAGWQINDARLQRAKPEAILMHPAPVNRGVEIAEDLVEHPRSWIQRQGGNGQVVRMAIMEWCLGAGLE